MEPLSMLDGAFGNAGVEQERVGLDFDFIWGFCFKQLKGVLQFTRSAEVFELGGSGVRWIVIWFVWSGVILILTWFVV